MKTEKIDYETFVDHPMEDVLGIEPGTTTKEVSARQTTDMGEATTEAYDNKDVEIEDQFQEVYDAAMDAYDQQMGTSEQVEGRYQARNGEVAVQFLNTALQAAKEKSGTKQHKDKLAIAKGKLSGPGVGKGDVLIADRNEILKALAAQQEKSVVSKQ